MYIYKLLKMDLISEWDIHLVLETVFLYIIIAKYPLIVAFYLYTELLQNFHPHVHFPPQSYKQNE